MNVKETGMDGGMMKISEFEMKIPCETGVKYVKVTRIENSLEIKTEFHEKNDPHVRKSRVMLPFDETLNLIKLLE